MVANNAFSQYGTSHPNLLISLFILFASRGSIHVPLSFIPMSCHSPPFMQLWPGERCNLPQRVRADPGRQMQLGEFWA